MLHIIGFIVALLIAFIFGFILCAILTSGKTEDLEREIYSLKQEIKKLKYPNGYPDDIKEMKINIKI